MSDADRSRLLARARKRRERALAAHGRALYRLRLDEVLVEDALVAAGLLPERDADNRDRAGEDRRSYSMAASTA